jgi:uncharacterized protein YjbI with pentapeptide repeats
LRDLRREIFAWFHANPTSANLRNMRVKGLLAQDLCDDGFMDHANLTSANLRNMRSEIFACTRFVLDWFHANLQMSDLCVFKGLISHKSSICGFARFEGLISHKSSIC